MADDEKPDQRPRPQYGELAPEGWVWHPPADAGRLDTSKPAHDPAGPSSETENQPAHGAPAGRDARGAHPGPARSSTGLTRPDAPRWNLTVTVIFLAIGLWGMTTSIGTLIALPTSIQMLHATENLAPYTEAPAVGPLLTAGGIIQAVIWAVSAGLSIRLLLRNRVSYYVPLLAGVVAFIAMIIILFMVVSTDPALLEFYGGVTTPTPGISTPAPGATP